MALFVGLQALEESHVGVGIVPRFVHILETEKIRFAFGVTREFQESEGYGHIHTFVDRVSGQAVGDEKTPGDGRQLRDFRLGGLACAVARRYVRDLVGHHARKLGLFLRAQNQTAVHIKKAAGQSKGVDDVRVDHLDGEGNLGVRVAHQVLAYTVHILGDDRIINQLGRLLNLLGEGFAKRHFLFEREELEMTADAAVANSLYVFFGILWVDRVFLLHRLIRARLLGFLRGLLRLGRVLLRRRILASRSKGEHGQQARGEQEPYCVSLAGVHGSTSGYLNYYTPAAA